jgi:hypothetical protein
MGGNDDPFGDFEAKTPEKKKKKNEFDDFDVFGDTNVKSKGSVDPFGDDDPFANKNDDPFGDEDVFSTKNKTTSIHSAKKSPKDEFFNFSKKKTNSNSAQKNDLNKFSMNNFDDPFGEKPNMDLNDVKIKQVESFTGHSISRTRQTGQSGSNLEEQKLPKKVRTLRQDKPRIGAHNPEQMEKIKNLEAEVGKLNAKVGKSEREKDNLSGRLT